MPLKNQLPRRNLWDLQLKVEKVQQVKLLAVTFRADKSGRELSVGGTWDPIQARYTEIRDGGTLITLTEPQFDVLEHALEALRNPARTRSGQEPIQDIIFHGPRRGGKSRGLFALCLLVMIARPASQCWVVGLRKRNGERIMTLFRHTLPSALWDFDKASGTLRLCNHSCITTKTQVNFDNDRGESIDFIGFDEAAFMKERVREALAPSTADRNGFCGYFTSPAPPNWFSRLVDKASSPEPALREAIRVVHAAPASNTFVPGLAARLERFKLTMSREAYERECEGKFTSDSGRVLPGFSREEHVVADYIDRMIEVGAKDATDRIARALLKVDQGHPLYPERIEFLIGVDYNIDPCAASIVKIDHLGRGWICGEVLTALGTEQLGADLEQWVKQQIGEGDPFKRAIVIADASGEYQDPRKYKKSAQILRSIGWKVFTPTGTAKNPRRHDRMEIARSLTKNAAGAVRLFVDAECEETIQTFLELDLNSGGLPNKSHKGNHLYDAATYPLYRVHGTALGYQVLGVRLVERKQA